MPALQPSEKGRDARRVVHKRLTGGRRDFSPVAMKSSQLGKRLPTDARSFGQLRTVGDGHAADVGRRADDAAVLPGG